MTHSPIKSPSPSQPIGFNRSLVDPNLPDHTQLPESDGTFVKNFQELPQSILLTDSLSPVLEKLHPDGNYAIGQDSGIYWRSTDPPEKGSEAPDWFYVPDVPPLLNGSYRRSYVLSREKQVPAVILEFASGDGSEERDATPLRESGVVYKPGKFWVYEQVVRAPYYGIYEIQTSKLEVYRLEPEEDLETWRYRKLEPNAQGRYWIPPLQVELGVWQGSYQNQEMNWMRWWDLEGNLLLTGTEQAKQEARLRLDAEWARFEAELERQRETQARIQAELERQRETQARVQAEAERQREAEARVQAELEQQREAEARVQAELERQREAEARVQAELERQRETQARVQAELERQREAEARVQAEAARLNAVSRLGQTGMEPEQIAGILSLDPDQVRQILGMEP